MSALRMRTFKSWSETSREVDKVARGGSGTCFYVARCMFLSGTELSLRCWSPWPPLGGSSCRLKRCVLRKLLATRLTDVYLT